MHMFGPLLLAATATLGAPGDKTFENDGNHTVLAFKAGTILFDVPGKFTKYTVEASGNPEQPDSAKVTLVLDAASVDTGNPKRDDHLRTADFFDVEKFPRITFTSSKVVKTGTTVTVTGTLELHGVKQEVTIPFETVTAVNGAGFQETVYKGKATVKNSAFGVGAQSVAAKISLKDEVELELLLAGFWNDPPAPAAAPAKAPAAGKGAKKAGK